MSELMNNTLQLEKLERQIKKQNSLSQAFLRGLATGLGATLGLSLFLGFMAVLLGFLASAFGLQWFFEPILRNMNIQ
jgi:hypothetical protein